MLGSNVLDLSLNLTNTLVEVTDQVFLRSVNQLSLLFLLYFYQLLSRDGLLLRDFFARRKLLIVVGVRVLFQVVLLQELLRSEHLAAMVALENLGFLGDLYQTLVTRKGLLLYLIFFFKILQNGIELLNLLPLSSSLLVQILVLHVEGSSETLEVVLGVD